MDTLETYCLYSMKTALEDGEPVVDWGFTIVYNPTFSGDDELLSGYVKVDLATLGREYSFNRYASVSDIIHTVQENFGRTIAEAFAGRYINGWYHKDVFRRYGTDGIAEFCCYLYDVPHTLIYLQRLRKGDNKYLFREFSSSRATNERLIEVRRVHSLGMGRYIHTEENEHRFQVRTYKMTPKNVELGDLYSYTMNDQQFAVIVERSDVISRLVYSTGDFGDNDFLLYDEDVASLIDSCELLC